MQTRWKVTGILTNGRRFPPIFTDSYAHARAVHRSHRGTGTLWRREGSHWRVVRRTRNTAHP